MGHEIFCIISFTLIGFSVQTFDEGVVKVAFRKGLEEFITTGQQSKELNHTLKKLQFPQLFRKDYEERSVLSIGACLVCAEVVNAGIIFSDILSKETFGNLVETLCIWFNIEPAPVCRGFVEVNIDTLLYIVDKKANLTPERVCSIILQFMGCEDPFRKNWVVDIPEANYIENVYLQKQSVSNLNPLKILQLSDIHYDIDYTIGSNAACEEPLCCRPGTKPENPKDAAGQWGDYRGCDTSWHVFTNTLKHIVTQHKNLTYFYFTGDIVDHKLWGTSIPRNTKVISDVLLELKNSLGSLPVFPILGNHDPHPLNAYSPQDVTSNVSTQWIFELVAEKWQMWLPRETRETILKGGYYTVLVKPGFRVIALNSNVCFLTNWWLLFDDVDPYGQLKWLVKVLLEAERNGEIVHILSHVPAGDVTCLKNWGREFAKIVNRFSKTIVAQFNGHTHKQDIVIFFNSNDFSQPVNIAFNGGSLTAWYNANPNYIVYDVDPESFEVLDYESWTYNLTDANLTPERFPKWYKLYSFKAAYGVESLRSSDMTKLVENIARNRSLAEQYFRFRFREADTALAEGCDNNCHIRHLCTIVTAYYEDRKHCDIITKMWNSNNAVF